MKAKHYIGLTDDEVIISRQKHGNNTLTPPPRTPLWKLFLEKFKDPIIQILLVAAALSLGIAIMHNEYAETVGILAAIFLATGVGFWFEMDADRKFDVLNRVSDDLPFKTMRNDSIREIFRKDLVVGDVVMLDSGEEVPADGELLEAVSLQIDESTLTGEPMTEKTTSPEAFDPEATYPSNRLLRGTIVLNGHCTFRIDKVGDATELGKVAVKSTEITHDKTPLGKQLDGLAKFISIIGFTVAGLVFITLLIKDILHGVLSADNLLTLDTAARILQYFMVAVTLLVVSVPEGLPMSVTLSLALSMRKMLRTNNLVRKMHACETIGATTVICTDKTGTLTQNRMQVYQTDFYALPSQHLDDSPASLLVREGIAVNSTAYLDSSREGHLLPLGNPTEAALLLWLHDRGIDYMACREQAEIIEQLPFSTERKYMATILRSSREGKPVLHIKGAPEIIFSKCDNVLTADGILPAGPLREKVESRWLEHQNRAMRTIGFAYKIPDGETSAPMESLTSGGFTFLGVAAISDPVREEVPLAVEKCLRAGINVKIVTGDTYATAREIARQIGIWQPEDADGQIISGTEFERLTDEEALERIPKLKIICRARPLDKQRLVELLKQSGAVVAVTGDGTNDAPALNYADVGLAMGSGTSVAKEAGDIVLLDDSFHSITTAVMWGRSLYHNIQRFILFQLTINLSALLLVLIGTLTGHELPLTVTQMLWVNLIIDTFAAAALASLPPDEKVLQEAPRKADAFIITPAMKRSILGIGITFAAVLLGILMWFTHTGGDITRYELSVFFTAFVMLQFWNLFNAKAFATHTSAFRCLKRATGFLVVMCIIPLGQFCIVQFGGEVFRTVPLSWQDWGIIAGATSTVLWVGELLRMRHHHSM